MADTRLILHVKGTDAETQELPKEVVKTAVAEGKLSYSQLIWSPVANTWKQVRELPDLLPGETLTLHVKGTESQTREMPKQAVKNAISRGEITHSQLIWSHSDSTWKQVREIPDLLPGETMILHVKGTQNETRELPKPAIRAAIQRGEISKSQLIWSPLDSAWKPVAEMPELNPGESLVLHVKGTTSETKEMPKKAIRTAIKEGKITHSQLIWSSSEHQWKQVRELPELLPSQKLAPAPQQRAQAPMLDGHIQPDFPQGPVARAAAAAMPGAVPQARPAVVAPPRVTMAPAAGATPKIAQPAVAKAVGPSPAVSAAAQAVPVQQAREMLLPQASSGPHSGHEVKEEPDHSHPVKWVCIILGAVLALAVGVNFLLVDRALTSSFAATPYANVFVYGHLGGYFQPNAIVIYIPRTDKVSAENFGKFMVALAQSTPKSPFTNGYFDRVALTTRWSGTAEFSFSGSAWEHLGEMKNESAEDIKTQILSTGADASTGTDMQPASVVNDATLEERREAEWKKFMGTFIKSGA